MKPLRVMTLLVTNDFQVYLVCNADKFKHFERWATGNDFPLENLVNDGTTRLENLVGSPVLGLE